MTPRVVVVDHHDSYTYNLVHLFATVTGTLPVVVEHDEVTVEELRGFSHVVLSPGPGTPDDPRDFAVGRALLRDVSTPVLGVCLGMQGIVTAYGGRVGQVEPAHGDVAVVGHRGDGLFRGVPQDFAAVRYHSLAALELPDVLEETAWCAPSAGVGQPGVGHGSRPVVMGVAHRSLPVCGVQFHPESILSEHGAVLVANFLELS